MITVRPFTLVLVVALTTTLLSACSGGSSGGVYNQAFNVSGQWTGTLSDSTSPAKVASMALSDGGGDVTGTLSVVGHTCISGGSLTGTAVQAPTNTTGDNPLTGDQENSNRGTVSLTVTSGQASGGVSAVAVSSGGSGYTNAPAVSFSWPSSGGSRAKGTAVIGGAGRIGSITVTNAGSGYTSNITVVIGAPSISSGTQAIAVATLESGEIVGFVITNPGSGYSIAPSITIADSGGGTGGVGTAVLNEADAGQVTGVVITNPGSGYLIAPTISFSGGGGSGAIATATIDTATVTDSVIFTLTGSSSSLTGQYNGVWKSTSTRCASQTQGTITLSRL